MFLAALTSRSWTAPHGQAHDRTFSGMDSASAPQAEHSLLLGNQRSIFTRVRPYRAALYSSMLTNADHPASCTDLASRVRARPFTHKSSTITAWFSRMIRVESWWVKSRRASATLAWARATRATALVRLFDPFALRDRAFCALRNRRSARRRNRGLPTFRPSESTAKCVSPRSMPTSAAVCGSGSAGASTTNEAKYRPAASLITVTLEGSDGRRRDHFTGTSPIFGRRSLPPAVIAKRALRVKRIACRLSLRDRKRGGATFGPFRFPDADAKKFR